MDAIAMDVVAPDPGVRAEFSGEPGRFLRVALVGTLLMLPTFGFYRFWLTTDLRRHLWTHTRLAGDAFEYTGRARELLIGFLMAMAILVPLYGGYFILALEAERAQAFASLPLGGVIYVLAHYGSYRARRYRATRTVFRGIRLWMTGSGWAYAWRAILWDVLTVVSLGLALPWRAAALERFKMKHTHFGDLPGSFAGSGGRLFKRGWWLWLLVLMSFLAAMAGIIAMGFFLSSRDDAPAWIQDVAPLTGIVFLMWIPLLFVTYPLYRAIQLRWWIEGVRFGGVHMTSSLRKRQVLWCYVKALLLGGVVSGIVGIVLATAIEATGFSFEGFKPGEPPPPPVMMGLTGAYIVTLLALSVVGLQFVTRGLWEAAVASVTVFNVAALDVVVAGGAPAGSLGEGLADALDFGAGMGV